MSTRPPLSCHLGALTAATLLFGTVAVASSTSPSASAAAASAGYAIVSATQKVFKTASVTGTGGAALMGARNEFVSFQIVLTGGQNGVSVSTGTPLTGRAGTIPNANITIYREDYVTTAQPSAAGRYVGAWPDILIPTVDRLYGQVRRAFPVDIPSGQNRVAFVDVLIPRDQPAGGYDGSLVVSNGSGGNAMVPVHLDVRDFTLPSTSSLRSLFSMGWNTGCVALYGNCDAWASEANLQRAWRTNYDFARLALDNRMTIANSQFQPPTSSGEINHFTAFTLPLINGTAATQLPGARLTTVDVDTGYLSTWRSLAQGNGFTDRALVYDANTCDELGTNSTDWNRCRSAVTRYKATWPALPNVMTATIDEVNTYDPTYAITDALVPVVDHMDDVSGLYAGDQHAKYSTFLVKPGKQVWLYTSCDVSGCGGANETDTKFAHPWVDYTIDTQAAQNRAMGWLDYVYSATGELYYSTTEQLTTARTNQWGFGGNGDGTLYYPGTTARIGGTTPIPLESLRMKMIRNGYQDYEYLRLATTAGHGTEALSIAKSTYPSVHDAGPSPAAIDTARAQLADLIDSRSALTYTGYELACPATVDGQLDEYDSLPTISFSGAGNSTTAVIGWTTQNLYLGYTITDATINVNQTGRDGELWNGDGVEVMIDRNTNRPATPNANDYHLLINTDNAITDERGNGTGWDRTWTANATTAINRIASGYAVEIALPWNSIGGAPTAGSSLGLDVANNDSDAPGQVTPYDWAHLTRFAQPRAWGTLTLE
jgi:hypothetical protein